MSCYVVHGGNGQEMHHNKKGPGRRKSRGPHITWREQSGNTPQKQSNKVRNNHGLSERRRKMPKTGGCGGVCSTHHKNRGTSRGATVGTHKAKGKEGGKIGRKKKTKDQGGGIWHSVAKGSGCVTYTKEESGGFLGVSARKKAGKDGQMVDREEENGDLDEWTK